jgi:hypothetical protein
MTLLDLWANIQQFGTGFVLFVGATLFFTGRLVNGELARQARMDAEKTLIEAHQEQMVLMRQRFEEMQTTWRERCGELVSDRNYYRSIALTFAQQAEVGIKTAEVAVTGRLPRPKP